MVQYMKYFESFIDIRKDIGMFHIHQVSHARVTNMDGMFIAGENDVPPSSLTDSKWVWNENNERVKSRARSLARKTLGVERHAGAPGWD
jgi:hypothetical protein